jgi:NADH-quinone oxidoreductase subunit N
MFYGNMVAIWQRNIKRMLAYSSIAQVGYIMIGVLTSMHFFASGASYGVPSAAVRADITNIADPVKGVPWDLPGVLIYMVAYLFMNLGAFAVVVAMEKRLGSDKIQDYTGLMKRSPFMASAFAVFLLSLAGVPPTAGFLGKLFIFGGAIKVGLLGHQELLLIALLGVINSVISAYYYLNVVRLMFFVPSASKKSIKISFAMNAVVAVALAVVLGLVVFASPVSKLASNAIYTTVVNRGNIK